MRYSIRLFGLLYVLAGFVWLAYAARAAPDQPTIVGGNPVPDPNPYVWQVSINQLIDTPTGVQPSHFCGGSVIAGQWVLTGAHCVVNSLISGDLCAPENLGTLQAEVEIIVGRRVLSDPAPADLFKVKRCIRHEQYVNFDTGNDIALIELARPIPNATQYIVPLLTKAQEADWGAPNTLATVTGWGNTIPGNNLSSPDILMALDLPILSNQRCNQVWATADLPILNSMVCAGFLEVGKSSCQGDSGGALVVPNGLGSYLQEGIVSFGPSICNDPNRVAVYTRVSAFTDWIEQQIGEDISTPRAPDLVVDRLIVTGDNTLGVVIRNQGTARVALNQGFWVDLYIGPQQAPTQVNETWNLVGDFGAAWGVDQTGFVLLPSESITLTLGDSVYWPSLSNLPLVHQGDNFFLDIGPDVPLYVQVDSANAYTDYGGILETHERFGEAYNNIAGPFFLDQSKIAVASSVLPHRLYLPLATTGNAATQAQSAQPSSVAGANAKSASAVTQPLPNRPQTRTEK